jgi:hypothetical protein
MNERKPLSGIVSAAGGGGGGDDWFDNTVAADDLGPLPRGTYVAVVSKFERTTAKTGTTGYTVTFTVIEGAHTGRRLWRTLYNTPAARPYTKRDLLKLGIDSAAKLDAPFPANRLVCKVVAVVRKDDDGIEKTEVKEFTVLRVQEPTADPFAPRDAEGGDE